MNLVPVDSAIRFGEIILPNSMVRVIGRTHPLNGGRVERYLQTGPTIRQMLEEALDARADMLGRCSFVVAIDGNPIEEANWHRVRAKAGTVVTFLPRLQGGGNALRSVLGIVVALAALAVAGPLGGAFAASAFGAALGVSAAVATALIGGGIVPVGPMALDVLWPLERMRGL